VAFRFQDKPYDFSSLMGSLPGGQIHVSLANVVASAHTRTVQPPGAERPAPRREDLAPVVGHGPSGPWLRTIRAATKGTVAETPLSEWRPDQHQHLSCKNGHHSYYVTPSVFRYTSFRTS
jgi:hypothetical protein